MKMDELKLMSDKKFYKYLKELNYKTSTQNERDYIDYVNKIKAGSLTAVGSSVLANLSIMFNKELMESNLETMEIFCVIGAISATVWLLVSGATYKEKLNKNDISITKKILEMSKPEDLKKLVSLYKNGKVEDANIFVKEMYKRLESQNMLKILGQLEIDNDVKYQDDSIKAIGNDIKVK